MKQRKILFVLTNHDRLGPAADDGAEKTGFHLAEAARPWTTLTNAGFTVDLVTPKGGPAPIDPSSRELDDADNRAFLENERVRKQLADSRALRDVALDEYEALYFPGGHGTMWDLPDNPDVQQAVRVMYEAGKPVAAVCHGPAALVNVRLSDGSWLVDGKRLSVFTNSEERATEKASLMPFLLATALEKRGATIRSADNFEEMLSIDEHLITGQNPASARAVGEAIRKRIELRLAKAA